MSSSFDASFRFRPFEHPLLRLAQGDADTSRKFRRFTALVRETLLSSSTREERLDRARQTLEQLEDLQLGDESVAAFKLEWLRVMAVELPDPILLEQLAFAELDDAEVDIEPATWARSERPGPALPHLSRKSALVFSDDVRAAATAWNKIVDLTIAASQEHELDSWGRAECVAACRAMVLRAISIRPGRFMGAGAQLSFLQGVGAALWQDLEERLKGAEPAGFPPIWSGDVHGRLVMHLRGLMARIASDPASAQICANCEVAPDGQQGATLVVVTEPIPPSNEKTDKEALKHYELLRLPMPLAPMPRPEALRRSFQKLASEFPWATTAIAQLEDALWPACLLGVKNLRIRPVLLVGKPGAGKSRLARRVAEVFELPYMPIGCGGTGDSKLLTGTARGWASGEPTPIVSFLLRWKRASAFVLLDEIDKATSNHYSSPPIPGVLLGLLEPETARRWRDGYLQAACDLSGVTFWATANSLSSIARPLLSRFEVVHVPEPGPEHLQSLADSITSEIERDWQIPEGTLPRLQVRQFGATSANARELRSALQRELASYLRETLRPERLH